MSVSRIKTKSVGYGNIFHIFMYFYSTSNVKYISYFDEFYTLIILNYTKKQIKYAVREGKKGNSETKKKTINFSSNKKPKNINKT